MYGYPGDEDAGLRARAAPDRLPARRGRPDPADHRRRGAARSWPTRSGLGKTFLAGELIAEATKRDRQRALVIVPAALKDSMWMPFLDTWDLTSARVKVMSYDELRLATSDELARARRVRAGRHRRGAQPAQPGDRQGRDGPPAPLGRLPERARSS